MGRFRNGPGSRSRIDVVLAAERHAYRSHAGAWDRGFQCRDRQPGSRGVLFRVGAGPMAAAIHPPWPWRDEKLRLPHRTDHAGIVAQRTPVNDPPPQPSPTRGEGFFEASATGSTPPFFETNQVFIGPASNSRDFETAGRVCWQRLFYMLGLVRVLRGPRRGRADMVSSMRVTLR
jgi:hypothetical protein